MDRIQQSGKRYLHYELRADALCIGERIRGSVFRPCVATLPYTTMSGALKERFPHPFRRIHAVGWLDESATARGCNRSDVLLFSPRDRAREVSVIPLEIEFLSDVIAHVLVVHDDNSDRWPSEFALHVGAMKSKGFGACTMRLIGHIEGRPARTGALRVRLPDDPAVLGAFGVERVEAPVYGYLFKPGTGGTGRYIRSLFEGSMVVSDPAVLVPQEALG